MAKRIEGVRKRLHEAARAADRPAASVGLVAVSKTQPAEVVRAAYDLGLRAFGENYLQDAESKLDALPADCEWHFIGALQSNKTRAVAERFAWVHTVDRLRIARRLSEQRPQTMAPLMVCVQVNIDQEPGKAGVAAGEAAALCRQIRELPGLRLRGLMCIPRATDDSDAQFASFDALRRLRDDIDTSLDTLSMGMSGDLEAAVRAGATLVRIGTAIFGPRETAAT